MWVNENYKPFIQTSCLYDIIFHTTVDETNPEGYAP